MKKKIILVLSALTVIASIIGCSKPTTTSSETQSIQNVTPKLVAPAEGVKGVIDSVYGK